MDESMRNEAIRLRQQGLGTAEIVRALYGNIDDAGYSRAYDRIRSILRRRGLLTTNSTDCFYIVPENGETEPVLESVTTCETHEETTNKERIEYKPNGDIVSERLVRIMELQNKTPEQLLILHGFDPKEFDFVSGVSNMWSMNGKDTERVNCQSKITVRKKKQANEITLEDIDAYFKNRTYENYVPMLNAPQNDDGEIIEVCLPDVHGGLFSWRCETGEDYDLHIAKDRFARGMIDIINRCSGRKIKKIFFVTLGDLLNFDNEEQSTTKRTPQQSDGRITKVHELILDMIVDAIHKLSAFAPIEVVQLDGNHDLVTGHLLMVAVSMAFRNNPLVTFDLSPNPLKFRHFGVNTIGWTHGDMPEKNMYTWLPQIAKRECGESTVIEVHAGHFHQQRTKEKTVSVSIGNQTYEDGGIVVRYLPTISSASSWGHKQGFPHTVKTIMSFVWDEELGLRDIWFSGVE